MRYLDPVSLARLKGLHPGLRRLAAEGHAGGRHRSTVRGFSRDFAQHRPYAPGDEVKSLDWKVYARADRFFVREYKAETILAAHLLVDASGSMGFAGGPRASKWELACRLAMAMGYLVTARGDAAGLGVFDTDLKVFLPPEASFKNLELMDESLSRLAPGGETDLRACLERAAARIKRRSLVVLVSDLLGEPEGLIKVIRQFQARRHELIVLQVLDPDERDFPYEGPVLFKDLEDGTRLPCEAHEVADLYRREFARVLKLYEASFSRYGINHGVFYTGAPWEDALIRLLGRWQ